MTDRDPPGERQRPDGDEDHQRGAGDRRGADQRGAGDRRGADRRLAGDPAGGVVPARRGRERAWRFLRVLVGLLLVAWLLPALFAPPDPATFLLWLVPLWAGAFPAAWYLVYRDGAARVRASGLYDPRLPAGSALAAFVLLVVAVKFAGTLALDVAVGSRPYALDAAVSIGALGVAYLLVYAGVVPGAGEAGSEGR